MSDTITSRPRLLHVVTSPLMVGVLARQLQYFDRCGFDVTVISPPGKGLERAAQVPGVGTVAVPMKREIAPFSDLLSLWRLCRMIRVLRPAITNVGTPKAGLLGGLAAWLHRVPCRVYTLRGLRFETTHGWRRRLLIAAEQLACRFAHRVICVSHSVREKAVACGLTSREKAVVFRCGSSNGVNFSQFAPTPEMMKQASELRSQAGIPAGARIIGFVGRLTRDKGIPELVRAFQSLQKQFPDLWLLLVGRFEKEDPLPAETKECIETHPRVILAGRRNEQRKSQEPQREEWLVDQPAPYYAAMDVLVLPSHREGFPNVVLEAQAARKPVVAAAATGVVDAVQPGETGLLFPVGDAVALAENVATLLKDDDLAAKLARAGQERVKQEFRNELIWEALREEYVRLLRTRDLPLPAGALATPRAELSLSPTSF